jgi:hypothetical protein
MIKLYISILLLRHGNIWGSRGKAPSILNLDTSRVVLEIHFPIALSLGDNGVAHVLAQLYSSPCLSTVTSVIHGTQPVHSISQENIFIHKVNLWHKEEA